MIRRYIGIKRIVSLVVIVLLMGLLFAGCSGKNSLAGEYIGTAGSYLKLNDDGTCIYAENDSTGTGTGTWYTENEKIYIDVTNLDYLVYGNIAEFDGSILLESNAGAWSDEYFIKED